LTRLGRFRDDAFMKRLLVCLGATFCTTTAFAQDTYVSVSLTGDISRFSRSETAGSVDLSGSGEALGFGLRLGTPLGSIWGVEIEYVRPSEIESDGAPEVFPLPRVPLPGAGVLDEVPAAFLPDVSILPFSYRIRAAQRNSTLSAGVWARQDFSSRFALVYSGGIGFHRTERELTITSDFFGPFPAAPGLPIVLPPPRAVDAIAYATRPFAGMDARVRMTDHVELVPGIRLHGLDGGLLVRPSVGLGWIFVP
jgi:hypothetical protein